jgi:hypothetical protein
MRRLFAVTLVALVAGGAPLDASQSGKSHKQKDAKHASKHDAKDHHDGTDVAIRVAFGEHDTQLIRTHYAPRYRNLPPGLQKKLARGGKLPPGWQKKFEPFPVVLERQLPTLAVGYRRGVIDGHAVIYAANTHVIVDVAVLF